MKTTTNATFSSGWKGAFIRKADHFPEMGRIVAAAIMGCFVTFAATAATTKGATVPATPVQPSPPVVHPIPSAPTASYAPASVLTLPGLKCTLHPEGETAAAALTVFSDNDGYVRFHAVRPTADGAVQRLTLECADAAGVSYGFSADLTSDATFAPNPVNLAKERGTDRPALRGDPESYSEDYLIEAGYGPRPDRSDTEAYSRWLKAASVSGRQLEANHPSPYSHTVYTTTAGAWAGTVLTGAPNYLATYATFNVPNAIPSGDETTGTQISIWNGLGGFNSGSGLIQGGVDVQTTPTLALYGTFREYCCGDGISNKYGGAFAPAPGHEIYSLQWYCDSKGSLNLNGGYGCSLIEDETSGAILSCTQANGSPCPSVPALPLCSVSPTTPNCMTLGTTAEFIIENASPQLKQPTNQFTDFAPEVAMYGAAYTSQTGSYSQTVSSDPFVYLLTDSTHTTSHMIVGIAGSEETYFYMSQWQQVGGTALSWLVPCPEAGQDCYPQSIAVGPNINGAPIGDAWVLGTASTAAGDFYIYQWNKSQWVKRPGAGTQIAISPQGVPWVIDHRGQIFYWTGSAFALAPGAGCASAIGVGPATSADPFGQPWVIGCDGTDNIDGSIYQLQGSTWIRKPGAAVHIAVSPQDVPWVVNASGAIFGWDNDNWVQVPGCATSIAVGPNSAPLAGPYGDVWVTGCGEVNASGYDIYQLQDGAYWVQIPGVASQISVSPDFGVPWVVTAAGQIFE
jgi:hypothetical protein